MKNQRREFFKKVGVGTAGLGLAASVPFTANANTPNPARHAPSGQFLQIGDDIAVARARDILEFDNGVTADARRVADPEIGTRGTGFQADVHTPRGVGV